MTSDATLKACGQGDQICRVERQQTIQIRLCPGTDLDLPAQKTPPDRQFADWTPPHPEGSMPSDYSEPCHDQEVRQVCPSDHDSRPLALLGGVFDPIHRGHVELARAALQLAEVEEVRWIPCLNLPHSKNPPLAPAVARLDMGQTLCSQNCGFV